MSKSARTRERILDSAATVLAEHGYHGTSLGAIAERIDMQAASIYYYFSSKDELVLAVLHRGTSTAREAVADAIIHLGTDPPPTTAIRTAIVAHLTAVLAQGPYTTANIRNYGQLPQALAARHREEQRSYGATWRDLIEHGINDGVFRNDLDARAVRLLILGAMNWSIEWFAPDNDLQPNELGEQLATMILDGITNTHSDDEPQHPDH